MRTLDWIVVLGFVAVAITAVLRWRFGPVLREPYRRRVEIVGIVAVAISLAWWGASALLHL